MKNRLLAIILLLACAACVHAEIIVLRTGARVKGTILMQNDEVVIIRDATGARFQYPASDVEEILTEESSGAEEETAPQEEEENRGGKKVSILLEAAGGLAVRPHEALGGAYSADLLVGTHHIGDKHLFVGAGVGYHGMIVAGEKYNFLPIQAVLRAPLLEQKHAPVVGVSVGYGVALSKDYLGGLYADAAFGYRCRINPKSAVAITYMVQFQQARMNVIETIGGEEYTNRVGRILVATGLKLSLYF